MLKAHCYKLCAQPGFFALAGSIKPKTLNGDKLCHNGDYQLSLITRLSVSGSVCTHTALIHTASALHRWYEYSSTENDPYEYDLLQRCYQMMLIKWVNNLLETCWPIELCYQNVHLYNMWCIRTEANLALGQLRLSYLNVFILKMCKKTKASKMWNSSVAFCIDLPSGCL